MKRASLKPAAIASDVVTVCSHSESFGLAALEAHACGIPVVASAVGGLKSLVDDGSPDLLDEYRSRDYDEIYDIGRRLYEIYTLPSTDVLAEAAEDELRRQAGKRKGIVLPLDRVASWDHGKLS